MQLSLNGLNEVLLDKASEVMKRAGSLDFITEVLQEEKKNIWKMFCWRPTQ